ncbi:MAG: N-acetylmuramoyl-L-alanine amidase [Myxococcales bacterium]|nr:N-acetylmuramoyl-L-alanine amidase [Myxococcales bacterium]
MTRGELGASLNLEIHMIDPARPNRPGTPMTPTMITVHNTSNTHPGADAAAHGRFLANRGHYTHRGKEHWVSWHYTVDDQRIVKSLPLNEVGWHAGSRDGNAQSIGVEICMNEGIDQAAAFDRTARLVAVLRYDLSLSIDKVVTHHHWTGKRCPVLMLDDGEPGARWQAFLDEVTRIHDALVADDQPERDLNA